MADLPHVILPTEPSLKDAFNAHKMDVLATLNCHHVGQVEEFNADEQTAKVSIVYKRTYFEKRDGAYKPVLVDYPVLVDSPVICLGGGGGRLTFPIAKGDECLVLFNDRDIDNWFEGSTGAAVATPRMHAFADAFVLVGLRSRPNVLADYDEVRTALTQGDATVAVGGAGGAKVLITNADGTLNDALQTLSAKLKTLTQKITDLATQAGNVATAAAAITVAYASPGGPAVAGPPVNAAAFSTAASSLTSIGSAVTTLGSDIDAVAHTLGGLLE